MKRIKTLFQNISTQSERIIGTDL